MNIHETFDPIVIDDFVPAWYQDALETMMKSTPLYYSDNSNHARDYLIPIYGSDTELIAAAHSGGLANMIFRDGVVHDERSQATITPMLYRLREIIGSFEPLRCRIAMNLSDGIGGVHQQHIDSPLPHTVLLYYINDSDGDTILYKERANPLTYLVGDYPDHFTIDMRVTPKKGRAVIFDGLQFHSVSSPKDTLKRQIINVNVLRHADFEKNEYVLRNRKTND
jgi:hypothetical protein